MDRRTAGDCQHRCNWTVVAFAALMLGALLPLGLASGEAVDLAAGAFGVRRSFSEGTPLCDVLARLAVLVPIGEVGTRPHGLAAVGGVVALVLLVARFRVLPVPGVPAAVAGGVALVGFSRPFVQVATLRPVAAIDFALLVAIVLLLELIRRDPTRSRVGLGLALACGLAAGAGWPIRAATWPVASALTLWALRRGERWPLLAPMLFVAGAGVVLGGVVSASPGQSGTVWQMLHRLFAPPFPTTVQPATIRAALGATADDLGVLPPLVAAVGLTVLVVRARADTIFSVVLWAATIVAALVSADILFARLALIAALAAAVVAAVALFAQSFGRAGGAVAVVLAVVVVLPPAIVGLGGAWEAPGRRTPQAVARRLDAAFDRQTVSIAPPETGDREAARWRRYALAIGGW